MVGLARSARPMLMLVVPPTTGADVRLVLDVPIVFDVAGGATVHSAMVDAMIGGIGTRLILDTGSTDHMLTKTLIDAVGLPIEPGEPGIDHAGASVPSWSVGDGVIEIGGHALELHSIIAIEGPPPFIGWGVGGFLSPQAIHASAWIVMDLATDRLVLIEASDAALDRWLADRHPSFRRLRLPRVQDAPTVVVRAAVEPGSEVDTLLNTGGRSTEFSAAVVPADPATDVQRGGTGLSGTGVMGRRVGPRTLRVGGDDRVTIPIEDLVVRDGMEDPRGMVGSDLLRGTVLVVAADPERNVRWLIPMDRVGAAPH
jgi:predicted aspartyl protease